MSMTRQLMLALVPLLAVPAVQASVVTWELKNVRFEDDGFASGSFTLDDQLPGLLKTFDITTTGGRTNPAFHYTPATTAGAVNKVFATGILLGQGKVNQLELASRSSLLTDNGTALVTHGNMALDVDPSREWLFSDDIFRHVKTGGFLVAAPEPAPTIYFVIGLLFAGIGLLRRI